jgi:hypothetical protein
MAELLENECARMRPLADSTSSVAPIWAFVRGFLVEFALPRKSDPITFSLRDAHIGMAVTSGVLPPVCRPGKQRAALVTSDAFGSVTAMVTGGKEGLDSIVIGLRWKLPSFGLQMLIGSQAAQTCKKSDDLKPLQEMLSGKRKRDDAAVIELFSKRSGDRASASEKALVAELKARRWRPSHELIDIIIERECWEVAHQLLSLPELGEDLAVRLAAARPGLIPAMVRHTFGSQRLAAALREHLPAAQIPAIIEIVLDILAAYLEYTEEELAEKIPGYPRPVEAVGFLSALADGCLTSLLSLEPQLLERVEDALTYVSHDAARMDNLYAAISACCSIRSAPRLAADTCPVEVCLLPLG